jgi:tetratricopeptide (TPR) repeat protein
MKNPADAIRMTGMHLEALEAMERGDLDRAAALFREELANDPDSAVVLTYLGTCERRSDPRRAAERFRRAIELRPAFEGPYIRLCELLHQTRQPAGVRSVAEEGLRQTEDIDGQLHFFRALGTFTLGGDPASALSDLEVAIVRAAQPAPAYRLRAAVKLRRLDDADGAFEDLERFATWATPAEAAWLARDPAFAPLAGDPRFDRLLRRPTPG